MPRNPVARRVRGRISGFAPPRLDRGASPRRQLARPARRSSGLPITACIALAYLCFAVGAWLAFVRLPAGFDHQFCVISRLSSRFHNPSGFVFMMFGLAATAALLAPVPGWLERTTCGCPRLRRCGRGAFAIGLATMALVGVERGLFPTHRTWLEVGHLTLAAISFAGVWLGLAMLAGAAGPKDAPRVPWRWLYRPPWFLAACALPLVVLFLMYAPLQVVPGLRDRLQRPWPAALAPLRTATFWQWYLTIGLFGSIAALVRRTARAGSPAAQPGSGWRIDAGHEPPPPHESRSFVDPEMIDALDRRDVA